MKEFLARVKRIDVLNLVSSKLLEKLVFPRERRKKLIGMLTKEKLSLEYLPNNDEILKVVNLAKSDIVLVMNKLGVKCFSLVHIKQYLSAMEEQSLYSSVLDEDDISLDLLAAFPSPEDITDLNPFLDIPEETILLPPTSIFLMVPTSNGRFVKVRKSTFCWLLSNNGHKLSSDRMLSVRQGVCFTLSNFNSKKQAATELVRKASIKEGDWCIFRKQGVHCIGQVLSFTYLSGCGAARTYPLPSVPTDPPQNKATARGVGCMCSWYKLKADRSLAYKAAKIQGFINIENYVSHLPAPTNIGSQLFLSTDAFTFFTNLK
ncbi:Tetratricopeptide repeat protein 23 [Frankliniella fusca]|uniref:Tetratricopeptide repeat protein 23 n=1 Tax=Frankliniella fusca TaxID=407009 RepID=A0AAE1HY27_9NEOP|nr:Tetratricopeptide repeat protein 23 [Frankliniella fusca]